MTDAVKAEAADRGLIRRALMVMHPGVPEGVSAANYEVLQADNCSIEQLARQLVMASASYHSSAVDSYNRLTVRRAITRAREITGRT